MLPDVVGTEALGVGVPGTGVAGVAGGVLSVEQPAKVKTASNAGKRSTLSLVCIWFISALASTSEATRAAFGFIKRVDDIEGNL